MKTEQGEIPALFSCWEAWGGRCPGGAGAPTPAREEGLQPYGALDCFRRRAIRRGLGASGKPPVRPQAHTPCPGGA